MRHVTIAALGAVVTVVFGASLASHASANLLSFSSSTFRVVLSPLIIEQETFGEPVKCNVTLEGGFYAGSFSKTRNAQIGLITRAIMRRPCQSFSQALIDNRRKYVGDGLLGVAEKKHDARISSEMPVSCS